MSYKLKTIALSELNYTALKSLGQAGDSFNDVITKLLRDCSNKEAKIPSSRHAVYEGRIEGGGAQ